MMITEQCDGYGISGIATTQFKVSVSAEEYAQKPPAQNAAVQFACEQLPMLLPKYYIINRVKKGGVVTFTCMDRMIFLDQTVNIAKNQFTNDKIDTWDVLETIRSQCGFSEVVSLGMGGMTVSDILPKLEKADVYMKSCRSILEVISKACAGFWRCGRQANYGTDSLIFHAFGSTPYAVLIDEVAHTAVSYGGEKGAIAGIIVTDGKDKTFFTGNTSDMFTTIQITTPYASEAILGNISQRIMGMTYKAWSCSKIKASTSGMITMGAQINLGGDVTEICNSVKIMPRAYGIFAEVGRNEVTESEFDYLGAISRQIEQCIKDNEKYGCMMFTRYQGVVFTADEVENGETVSKSYGFGTYGGGITEYDGAMVSKVVPSSATWNADKSEAVVSYGEKKYKYGIQRDSGGNVTSFTKEEVVE